MKRIISICIVCSMLVSCKKCDCDKSTITASFNFDNYDNTVEMATAFTSNVNNSSVNDKVIYLWDFGDNTTSTDENPSHKYSAPGQYNVKLTVTNSCQKSYQTATRTVNIIERPQKKVIPMYRVGQQTKVWCWAACSEMVLNYYQRPTPQCYILSRWFNADCCTYALYCQTGGNLDQICTNLRTFGQLNSAIKNEPLSLSEIANEVANNRPIISAYRNFESGHVVVIFGYDLPNQLIYIYDPFYPNMQNPSDYSYVVPYTTTFTYGGDLQWTNTIWHIGYN